MYGQGGTEPPLPCGGGAVVELDSGGGAGAVASWPARDGQSAGGGGVKPKGRPPAAGRRSGGGPGGPGRDGNAGKGPGAAWPGERSASPRRVRNSYLTGVRFGGCG